MDDLDIQQIQQSGKMLTDSQKIDILNKRLKRMEVSQHIQTLITVVVFLGVVNFAMLVKKAKNAL